jgi:four helix bundle protein
VRVRFPLLVQEGQQECWARARNYILHILRGKNLLLLLKLLLFFTYFLTIIFMFDFEKLQVYAKAKEFNFTVIDYSKTTSIDSITKNQLRRASMSIVLNIAEGSGRNTKADKKNFMVISRGSVFECVAIFDILLRERNLSKEQFDKFYRLSEELSKMLYAMIGKLEK